FRGECSRSCGDQGLIRFGSAGTVIPKALAQLSRSLCTAYVLHGHDDLFHNVENPLEISHDLLKLIGPSLAIASKPQEQAVKSLFKREFPLLDLGKLRAGSQ